MVNSGYIVVTQDVRGRYASDGKYDSQLGFKTHDAEDGYDAVEWAAKLPGSSGRVGTFGVSSDAWLQWKLAALRPPSLGALFAYSEPMRYPDLEGPGTIRPGRRLRWFATSLAPASRKRAGSTWCPHSRRGHEGVDCVDRDKWLWFLPWSELPDYVLEEFKDDFFEWLKNPMKDQWQLETAHYEITVPNYMVTGWYDHVNFTTIDHYLGMVAHGKTEFARKNQKLLIGPWNRIGLGEQTCGGVDFGPDARVDLWKLMVRLFDHWLKGIPNGIDTEPPVKIFVMGKNKWRFESEWPIARARDTEFYLTSEGKANSPFGDGSLSLSPRKRQVEDRFTYDPRNPVMSVYHENFFLMPADHRVLDYRKDIRTRLAF